MSTHLPRLLDTEILHRLLDTESVHRLLDTESVHHLSDTESLHRLLDSFSTLTRTPTSFSKSASFLWTRMSRLTLSQTKTQTWRGSKIVPLEGTEGEHMTVLDILTLEGRPAGQVCQWILPLLRYIRGNYPINIELGIFSRATLAACNLHCATRLATIAAVYE
jgi:hypothetical protein